MKNKTSKIGTRIVAILLTLVMFNSTVFAYSSESFLNDYPEHTYETDSNEPNGNADDDLLNLANEGTQEIDAEKNEASTYSDSSGQIQPFAAGLTINFNPQGGTMNVQEQVRTTGADGRIINFPQDPSLGGSHFVHWNRASNGTGAVVTSNTAFGAADDNTTVFAIWGHMVTFDNEHGTNPPSIVIPTGSNANNTPGVSWPANPAAPSGMSFQGWFTSGGTTPFTGATAITGFTALYARFDVAPGTPQHVVTFDPDGGSLVANHRDTRNVFQGTTVGAGTNASINTNMIPNNDWATSGPATQRANMSNLGWMNARHGQGVLVSHTSFAFRGHTPTHAGTSNAGMNITGPTTAYAAWGHRVLFLHNNTPNSNNQHEEARQILAFTASGVPVTNGNLANNGMSFVTSGITTAEQWRTVPQASRGGYSFAGWYIIEGMPVGNQQAQQAFFDSFIDGVPSGAVPFTDNTVINNNMFVVAAWTRGTGITLTFDPNGGTWLGRHTGGSGSAADNYTPPAGTNGTVSFQMAAGANLTNTANAGFPRTPVREGYIFTGWVQNPNLVTTGFQQLANGRIPGAHNNGLMSNNPVDASVTVFANWMPYWRLTLDANVTGQNLTMLPATRTNHSYIPIPQTGFGSAANITNTGTSLLFQMINPAAVPSTSSRTPHTDFQGSANIGGFGNSNAFERYFVREGYFLLGFNASPDGSGARVDTRNIESLGQDLTVYAQWAAPVTFNNNMSGAAASTFNRLIALGLNFATNSTHPNVESSPFRFIQAGTGNINLTSVSDNLIPVAERNFFTSNGTQSTLTSLPGINPLPSAGTNMPNGFTPANHHLVGWNTQADGQGQWFTENTVVTEPIQVFAIWQEVDPNVVTFDLSWAAGEATDAAGDLITNFFTRSFTPTQPIANFPANPYWEGRNFRHWQDAVSGLTVNSAVPVPHAMVLTAHWQIDIRLFHLDGSVELIQQFLTSADTGWLPPHEDMQAAPPRAGWHNTGWWVSTGEGFSEVIPQVTYLYRNTDLRYGYQADVHFDMSLANPTVIGRGLWGALNNPFVRLYETQTINGSAFTMPNAPVHPVHPDAAFSHWVISEAQWDPSAVGQVFDANTPMTFGHITVEPVYTNVYSVSFDLNGGNPPTPETQYIWHGFWAVQPADPTHPNTSATFEGWALSTNQSVIFDFATTPIVGDIILVAQWSGIGHQVTFDPANGQNTWNVQVAAGQTVSQPSPNPERATYAFLHWSLQGETTPFDFATQIHNNITLVAQWEEIFHDVTLDLAGGTGITTLVHSVREGQTLPNIGEPTKNGYTFNVWMYNGSPFDLLTPITAPKTLVADWTRDTGSVTISVQGQGTITFAPYTGSSQSATNATGANTFTAETGAYTVTAADGAGYRISHFIVDGVRVEIADINGTLNKNQTLVIVAVFTEITLFEVIILGGGTGALPAAPDNLFEEGYLVDVIAGTRNGWLFLHWNVDGNATLLNALTEALNSFYMPDENVTLTAFWELANAIVIDVDDDRTTTVNAPDDVDYTVRNENRDNMVQDGDNIIVVIEDPNNEIDIDDDIIVNIPDGWLEDGRVRDGDYIIITVIPRYNVIISNAGTGFSPASNVWFRYQDTVSIDAGSRSDFTFVSWSVRENSLAAAPTGQVTTFTMPHNHVLLAVIWNTSVTIEVDTDRDVDVTAPDDDYTVINEGPSRPDYGDEGDNIIVIIPDPDNEIDDPDDVDVIVPPGWEYEIDRDGDYIIVTIIPRYNVIISNGGTGFAPASSVWFRYQDAVSLNYGIRTGWTFAGWVILNDTLAAGAINSNQFTMPYNHVSLRATWRTSIVIDVDDDRTTNVTSPPDVNPDVGNESGPGNIIVTIPDPEGEIDIDDDIIVNLPDPDWVYEVERDGDNIVVTITPRFRVTIIDGGTGFRPNHGSNAYDQPFAYGDTVTLNPGVTAGLNFNGWTSLVGIEASNINNQQFAMPNKAVSLTATWVTTPTTTTQPPVTTTTTQATTTQPQTEPETEPDTETSTTTPPTTTAPATTAPTTAPTTEPTTEPEAEPSTTEPTTTAPTTTLPTTEPTTPNGNGNGTQNGNGGGNDPLTPPLAQYPENEIVQDGDYFWELDDQGAPLGRWEWDEAEEMWLFDDEVPLAYFPPVSAQQEQQATMPRTGVASIPTFVYVVLFTSMVATVITGLVIKKETSRSRAK